jgi:hypothetical protein
MKRTNTEIFVVQHPHSDTNDSNKYRVCEIQNWLEFVNRYSESYDFTTHDSYEAAKRCRDFLNRKVGNKVGKGDRVA